MANNINIISGRTALLANKLRIYHSLLKMIVKVITYGRRHSKPPTDEYTLSLDARKLAGPAKSLRNKTGLDKDVYRDIMESDNPRQMAVVEGFRTAVEAAHRATSEMVVLVGCDEGRHKAVSVGEWIKCWWGVANVTHQRLELGQ